MDEDMRYTGEENLNTTGTDPDGLSSDGYPQNGGQPGDDGMEVQDTYIPDEGYTPDPEFTPDQEDTSAPETAPDPEFTPDQEDTSAPAGGEGQNVEDASGQQSDMTDIPEQQAQGAEIPGDGSAAPQDRPHDFDVDEPRFDTQTGEPLDKPKKKYPGIILTVVVTAAAVGAFVYAVMPGKLPSAVNVTDNSASLAIASTEAEEEQVETESVQNDTVMLAGPAAQTEAEAAQTESELTAAPGSAETEGETEAETEMETETEKEESTVLHVTPQGTDEKKKEEPEFKTEGVILSASLDVSDMVEEVMPGIVSVTCTNIKTVRDFFYGVQEIQQTDAGSGIIVSEDDDAYYIVTDAWIVSGAEEMTVGFSVSKEATKELSDEDTLAEAELVGLDRDTELAMLRVLKKDVNEVIRGQVKPSVIGDSDAIRVGERAIAIGNAMGYGLSVTEGIISALNRQMSTGIGTHSFIQTDASINYGNYGGALLNAQGEVIGINAGKISRDSGEGMGYAFPINSAKDAITEMIGIASGSSEEVQEEQTEEAPQKETESKPENQVMLQVADPETEETKESEAAPETEEKETQPEEEKSEESISKPSSGGTLGVSVGEVSDEYSIIYRIPKGAYIMEVMDGSGAQKAGLRADDVIIRINDTDITSVMELKDVLASTRPGDKVKVTYLRPDGNGDYDSDRASNVTVTLQ